jgi:hypothetical protein
LLIISNINDEKMGILYTIFYYIKCLTMSML